MQETVFYGYYFRTVFRSHERSEALFNVVLNSCKEQVQADFSQWWQRVVPAEEPGYDLPRAPAWPADELYERACRQVKQQVRTKAAQVMAGANALKQRELAKIAGFYEETEAEIRKKLRTAGDQERKSRLEKQLAATQADRVRREQDALERYGVEADVRLDYIVAYHVPCIFIKLDVQHRESILNFSVMYNPLSGEVEAPVCPRCGEVAWTLEPDQDLRLGCAEGCKV